MTWLREALRRLATLVHRGRFHRELNEEIQNHLDLKTQSGIESGLSPDQARSAARLEFGNSLLIREQGRDAWGWLWIDRLGQDLRYAWRQLRRSPGFALVAVLTIALGIGANAVIFSAVNAVILNPLPFRDAHGILTAWVSSSHDVVFAGPEAVCGPYYQEWQKQTQLFAEVGGFNERTANFTGRGTPERLIGSEITASLFPLLRVSPALGRAFATDDQQPAKASVVLISDRLWRSRFASDPGVIGQSIKLDDQFFTVTGVMPPGLEFPNDSDFWTPLVLAADCNNASMRVLVRLQPHVPMDRARAAVGVLAADLDRRNGNHGAAGTSTTLMPLGYEIGGDLRTPLLVLFGAVGLVLLIACVNVANLLMARSAARQREIAIRSALGAGRARVIRQMLTESVLLGVLGGALGLLLAYGGYPLVASAASHLPHSFFGSAAAAARMASAGIDGRVLGFTVALSLLTGVLFGLAPAWRISRTDLAATIKEGGGQSGLGARQGRFQSLLVTGEIALALIVLVGAGLLIRSFLALMKVDPGFDPANVLTMNLSLPESRYPTSAAMIAFEQQVLARLSNLPGCSGGVLTAGRPMMRGGRGDTAGRPTVRGGGGDTAATAGACAAGVVFGLPFGELDIQGDTTVEGAAPPPPGSPPLISLKSLVGGDYFRAAGIPLRSGRAFDDHDTPTSPHVLMISESLARRLWPQGDPIGKRVDPGFSDAGWYSVVGVAGDVKQFALSDSESFAIYLPYQQSPIPFLMRDMTVVLRTSSDPLSMIPAVRRVIEGVDPELPLYEVASMQELVYRSVSEPRLNMALLAAFAALALVLAAVGIYGVMSYSVTQRTREIGVRMALGARRADVLRSVVSQGAKRAAAGIALGLIGALFLTRFLTSLLFGVKPTDPVTLAAVAALLAAIALLACYIPARRATRIDPLAALRCE